MGYIEGKINRGQISFASMSFDEMIGEDNPVRAIDAFVEMLGTNALHCKYSEPKSTGRRPYNPKDMLKLYV